MMARLSMENFQKQYNKFQNTYTNEGPVIVMYFQLNNLVKVYMAFHGVIWCTVVPVSEGQKYLSIFHDTIKLEEDIHG